MQYEPKYDTSQLQAAFKQFKAACVLDGRSAPIDLLAKQSGVSPATVHRIVRFGIGKEQNVDAVAKALGFKHGTKDVVVKKGRAA